MALLYSLLKLVIYQKSPVGQECLLSWLNKEGHIHNFRLLRDQFKSCTGAPPSGIALTQEIDLTIFVLRQTAAPQAASG